MLDQLSISFVATYVTAILAFSSAAQSQNVCKNVTLTLEDVVFGEGCGKNPRIHYEDTPGSSFFEVFLDNGFIAKKHLDKYPDDEYTACLITMVTRYPLGCTFSPSFVAFYGHANISRGHTGRVGLTMIDTHNSKNRLDFHTKEMVNTSQNFAVKANLAKRERGFWAPCKGEAWLHYNLSARIEDQDETKRGQHLSTITVSEGSMVYRNTATLGFKECNPDN